MATWLLSDFLEAWGQRMSIYHTRNKFKQGSPRMDGDSLGLGGNYIVGNNLECLSKVVPGWMETAWGWVILYCREQP